MMNYNNIMKNTLKLKNKINKNNMHMKNIN